MCGIAGYIGNYNLSQDLISKTLSLMANRGPDHQGHKSFKFGNKRIHLLASRLSIVDRKIRSNQPMSFNNITIVFNGEIYNFKSLTKKISNYGIKLKTNSDTELILRMYEIFGTKCVNQFEGMWSFLILDKNKDLVFLSRDRIGEKPLYFYKDRNNFYFGSETKFIRLLNKNYKELNDNKIFQYLKYGYKSIERSKESFFKNIFKVEPGTNLIVKKDLSIKRIIYWKPKINEKNFSESKCVKLIQENFKRKIKLICDSDLKIGLSLSGGIDSNFILGFIKKNLKKKITTYSIIDKQSKKYDEEKLINYLLKKYKIENKKIYLTSNMKNLDEFKNLTKYHDKPISTITLFLQSMIYKKMKEDNIKICLNGNGSDELFSGYYHHYNLYYSTLKNHIEKKNFLTEWKKNILPVLRNKEYKEIGNKKLKTYFTLLDDKYLKIKNMKLKSEKFFTKNLLRNKMLNELIYQTVPLALADDDLNSMHYSIENRSPFLNKELIDISFQLPSKIFMKDSYNKYLLRLSSKGFIHDKIRLEREKKGFNASFNSVFPVNDRKFKEWFFDENKKSKLYNYISKDFFLKSYKKSLKNSFSDLSNQGLFNILSLKIFLEEVI